jgi:hypothetical protein
MTDNEIHSISLAKFIEEFNETVSFANNTNFFVRDIELQKKVKDKLGLLKRKIKAIKYEAIKSNDSRIANMFFHFQCVVNSFISIFEMWIFLKEGKNREAWSSLIDSQEYIFVALRITNSHFGLREYLENLEKIETTIFPKFPVYNSVAFVEADSGQCSICKSSYGSCEHVEGYVYLGSLCQRINRRPIEFNHTALVEVPRDRRCIITKFTESDGITKDYITGKTLATGENLPGGTLGSAESIILNLASLDFD